MTQAHTAPPTTDAAVLDEVAQKVLWLSTSIVDAANRGRPNASGVKVGGHQASSASMVDIMVSLWFSELTRYDRISVKPHASPALHAINYLLGDLAAVVPQPAEGARHGRLLDRVRGRRRHGRPVGRLSGPSPTRRRG